MRPSRISWPLALVLVAVVIAVSLFVVVNQLSQLPGRSVAALFQGSANNAKQVRDAFVDLFQIRPRITVHDQVIFAEAKPVLELALASRETQVSHEVDQTWFGSTKHLRISGTYLVKAGYDLNEKLSVDLRDRTVVVDAPAPKILSVEQKTVSVEELRDGLWNRIQPADVEAELRALPQLAEQKEHALPHEAADQFRKLLQEKLPGFAIRVQSPPPAAK